MERHEFTKVVEEVLDSLPKEFRKRIRNVAVLVEDFDVGGTRLLLAGNNSSKSSR